MSREVTLVLVDGSGSVLGALPPFEVAVPYWPEVAEVVAATQDRYGLRVDVLRLLTTERPVPHGGAVTYLAEVAQADGVEDPLSDGVEDALSGGVELDAVDPEAARLALADEPLRAAYAEVGGPRRSVSWALDVLGPLPAAQQRTWNLSAIWRFGGPEPVAWLKQVPHFFAHEAFVLGWLGEVLPGHAPRLLAAEDQRMLLEHVPGEDLYDAAAPRRDRIAELSHRAQLAGIDAADALTAAGVPDRRGPLLVSWLRTSLERWIDGHPAQALLAILDERLASVADCGLPDTLVHGDAHPGNAIGDGDRVVLLDWGDSFVGCPAFDALRVAIGLPRQSADDLLARWARRWEASVPGSSPLRAAELLKPVEGLFLAAVYANFVANIEPTERRYHLADITRSLDAAAAAL